ncbi:hypothetical protein BLA24_13980 [Streptomyces cinnamoneus]|uniref:4'-phosphopantetheinyl transferase domain-containing protein n=1 Tax=Streptomyces cinnamoneus TaxID=53446 RepID=A0A2G1XJN1_STRCJ|nr:4'-phosphopantetheinyl transferase superfamily protein [Streptomyces cinnamoneus]PHQ51436.1 hypothetical protein BLA24_13980 [Streptomyces cinnamoneus]PPT11777.1 hypothetical protein CYQ11_01675 [Streptomyces cinnamoneus]
MESTEGDDAAAPDLCSRGRVFVWVARLPGRTPHPASRDAARVWARAAVARHFGTGAEDVRWTHGRRGRPRLVAPERRFMSLSHSGDVAAVALTTAGPVGVDVQVMRRLADPAGLVGDVLTPEEAAHWRRLPAERRADGFFTHWARKEAVIKVRGRGFPGDLPLISTSPAAARTGEVHVRRLPGGYGPLAEWSVLDLPAGGDFRGCVACRAPGPVGFVVEAACGRE